MKLWGLLSSLVLFGLGAAGHPPPPAPAFVVQKLAPTDIRYVAVGDSYTCGTGATPQQAWPTLLAADLRARGVPVGLAANLGVEGWTTQDALTREMPAYAAAAPTFATLLIGVNDTYRPSSPAEFRARVGRLLDRMQAALPDRGRLIVLTIPDYSVTPVGHQYAAQNDGQRKIALFNAILADEARARQVPLVDITPLSQQMGKDSSLVAPDGLHPSSKEYAIWEKLILPRAVARLQAEGRKAPAGLSREISKNSINLRDSS